MKKVVIKEVVQEVSINNLSLDKYYGIKESPNWKGFITQSDYESNRFVTLCSEELTRGNGWEIHNNCRSLKTLIERLLKSNFEVYEFDTHKELFKWLSE